MLGAPHFGTSSQYTGRHAQETGITGTFGYGIIGCGWVASAHAWGVRSLEGEGVRLVALADSDAGRARALAGQFGEAQVFSDYRQLLARDDIHAVSICLPDFLHTEATLEAAACGKHVLCEKPLAVDLAGADEMVSACIRGGVRLGIVMNHRYARDNIATKAAIRGRALGTLVAAGVLHSSALTGDPDATSPWRGRRGLAAGGVLATQAIHFLDLLLWFAGPVASVQAYTARLHRFEFDYEDTAALAMQLRSGALATLVTTNLAPIMDDLQGTRLDLHGTAGHVSLHGDRVGAWHCECAYEDIAVTLPGVPREVTRAAFGAGHVHQVVDFVRAIRRGADAPVPGLDGRHLIAVLMAADDSARTGRRVQVAGLDDAYSRISDDESLLSSSVSSAPFGPA
ncbi:MAG: Gfo/Idh/MocA family protein [Candidatus Dormibacteraceae bacterium]